MEFYSVGQLILSMAFEIPCYYTWTHLMDATVPYELGKDEVIRVYDDFILFKDLWLPEFVMN